MSRKANTMVAIREGKEVKSPKHCFCCKSKVESDGCCLNIWCRRRQYLSVFSSSDGMQCLSQHYLLLMCHRYFSLKKYQQNLLLEISQKDDWFTQTFKIPEGSKLTSYWDMTSSVLLLDLGSHQFLCAQ